MKRFLHARPAPVLLLLAASIAACGGNTVIGDRDGSTDAQRVESSTDAVADDTGSSNTDVVAEQNVPDVQSTDVAQDAGSDTTPEANVGDAPADSPADVATDVPTDLPTDVGSDTSADANNTDANNTDANTTDAPVADTGSICSMGQTMCGTSCVNTASDPANCGMCGRSCGTGMNCTMGTCSCATGQVSCGAGMAMTCVDVRSDNNNCGMCGNTCPSGQSCSMGACVCPMGQTSCGTGSAARCVNVQTDNSNCGACGTTCPMGQSCSMGSCVCPMGQTRCGSGATSTCVDTSSNVGNCGACGTACATGQVCNAGRCEVTCSSPRTRCGTGATQVCTDTQADENNCGMCGTQCTLTANAQSAACLGGSCSLVCRANYGNCDNNYANGCETDVTINRNHCGRCGNMCPAGNACVAGTCVAHSCQEILTNAPGSPSGIYQIDPDDAGPIAPFDAYCDMTSDGGGWTLILKADGATTSWAYAASRWTDNTTLNPTSPVDTLEDAKYPAYNALGFTAVRLLVRQTTPTPAAGFGDRALRLSITGTSMLAVMNAPRTNAPGIAGPAGSAQASAPSTNPRADWDNLFEDPRLQCNCLLQGANLRVFGITQAAGNESFLRLGIFGNQENDCQTPDSMIGIGASGGVVVGSMSTLTWACTNASNTTVTRTGFAWVFVR